MRIFHSPLRYPGGKSKLAAFIAKICADNGVDGQCIEPYSGGASVSLFLLLEGFVKRITINDKDRSIYAFWYSVLYETSRLCNLIEKAVFSIEEWRKQKEVQFEKASADLLDLGFSTLYLNRTNRSGIINAGVIGGIGQTGKDLIDCRFNKLEIIDRIQKIAARKNDIFLYQKDAIELIDQLQDGGDTKNSIFYFDPPYYLKASTLYMNHYKEDEHRLVSEKIREIQSKWIVSYDNVPEISELYRDCLKHEYAFKHTAYGNRLGQEVLFFSSDIKLPSIENNSPINFRLKEEGVNQRIDKKTGVIYARVSTQKQEYKRQIEDLKKYAKTKNIEIIGIFEEKISGYTKNEERPALQSMLIFCKKNNVDSVFASELSRIGRKPVEVLQFLEELDKIKVGLVLQNLAIETRVNGEPNRIADLFIGIAVQYAKMERDAISERLASGRALAIQEGKRMGRKVGSVMSTEAYEKKYLKEINLLKKGYSLEDIEKLTSTSTRTLNRLKKKLSLSSSTNK